MRAETEGTNTKEITRASGAPPSNPLAIAPPIAGMLVREPGGNEARARRAYSRKTTRTKRMGASAFKSMMPMWLLEMQPSGRTREDL
jgi:hypothetical protein